MAKNKNNRSDGFTPEEIQAAIEAYKARKAGRTTPPTTDGEDTPDSPQTPENKTDAEEAVQTVKDRRDRRDAEDDPSTPEDAMGVIAQQDEDIESLLQVIAELMARQDNEDTPAAEKEDSEETDPPVQKDDETAPPAENKEDSEDKSSPMNMDSVDQIVRQHLEIARLGDKLGLKGLDTLPVKSARKRIIKAVQPDLRLDGKDSAYIDAAFDIARSIIAKRKPSGTDAQRKTMFSPAQSRFDGTNKSASSAARDRMIARMKGEDKQ